MAVQRYRARISGPLLDRVDIHLSVPPVAYDDLTARKAAESSTVVRQRVESARARRLERFREVRGVYANAHMGPRELARFVRTDAATDAVLKQAIVKLGLSARAYHRVLKLARTLADLEGAAEVGPQHVGEAIQYRVLDRGRGRDPPGVMHRSNETLHAADPHCSEASLTAITPDGSVIRHSTPLHATPRHSTPRHATPRHATRHGRRRTGIRSAPG